MSRVLDVNNAPWVDPDCCDDPDDPDYDGDDDGDCVDGDGNTILVKMMKRMRIKNGNHGCEDDDEGASYPNSDLAC